MKTTKRILAVALAVLMLALAVPFAASAAHTNTASTVDYTLTLNCNFDNYTYTVYKIADYDETTGEFFGGVTPAINTAIHQAENSTAGVLSAADAATLTGGTEVTFDSSSHSETLTLKGGMYYVKCTKFSIKNDKVTKNNIVPLPNSSMTDKTYTVDIGRNKISEGGVPTVTKDIQKADGTLVKELSVKQEEPITYVLKADIAGTKDNKLAKYIIGDQMDEANLSLADVDIKSVELVNGETVVKSLTYTKLEKGDPALDSANYTYSFGVSINSTDQLDSDDFYNSNYQVKVVFTTKLSDNANKFGQAIPNEDGLTYENKSGQKNEVEGDKVDVYTYKIKVVKADADAKTKMLGGAQFKIYKNYNETTKTLSGFIAETPETDATTGEATFDYKFAEGTYYVQESKAPDGYNMNSDVYTVTITKGGTGITDGVYGALTVYDSRKKLPETGGAGTLAFTIVGGALIAAAGVLLVIVLKKRSAK